MRRLSQVIYAYQCEKCKAKWSQRHVDRFHGGSLRSLESEHNKLLPNDNWHTIREINER